MNQQRNDTEPMTTVIIETSVTGAIWKCGSRHPLEEMLAWRQLAKKCSYAFRFNRITFSCSNGILKLEGSLPSFYLKQVLQTLLQDLDGDMRIDNQIDVISPSGLSSVRSN